MISIPTDLPALKLRGVDGLMIPPNCPFFIFVADLQNTGYCFRSPDGNAASLLQIQHMAHLDIAASVAATYWAIETVRVAKKEVRDNVSFKRAFDQEMLWRSVIRERNFQFVRQHPREQNPSASGH